MIAFNVAQLLKAPMGAIRRVEVDELDQELAADLHLVSPTRGSLRLMRTAAGILVKGSLTQEENATCARCLDSFVRTQEIKLEEEFIPVVDVVSGVPLPEPEDPDVFRLTTNHLLDLGEAIRQYAILEDPLQPLCSPGCKGLCSQCGANLNLGPCGCESASEGAASGAFGSLLAERMREAGLFSEQE